MDWGRLVEYYALLPSSCGLSRGKHCGNKKGASHKAEPVAPPPKVCSGYLDGSCPSADACHLLHVVVPHWESKLVAFSRAPNGDEPGGEGGAKYLASELGERELWECKAAGVLPWRIDPSTGKVVCLVCVEKRKSGGKMEMNFIGGKVSEADANVVHTAVREFHEETGRVLPEGIVLQMYRTIKSHTEVYWIGAARYAMFLYEMNHDIDIDTQYTQLVASGNELPEHCKSSDLVWIPLASVSQKRSLSPCFFMKLILRDHVLQKHLQNKQKF